METVDLRRRAELAQLGFGAVVRTSGTESPGAVIRDLVTEIDRLSDGIREHRDARGDDRCHHDDTALYRLLPEGYEPPEMDTAVELERCMQFIACRKNPATVYVSPQREIDRLSTIVEAMEVLLRQEGVEPEHKLGAVQAMLRNERARVSRECAMQKKENVDG